MGRTTHFAVNHWVKFFSFGIHVPASTFVTFEERRVIFGVILVVFAQEARFIETFDGVRMRHVADERRWRGFCTISGHAEWWLMSCLAVSAFNSVVEARAIQGDMPVSAPAVSAYFFCRLGRAAKVGNCSHLITTTLKAMRAFMNSFTVSANDHSCLMTHGNELFEFRLVFISLFFKFLSDRKGQPISVMNCVSKLPSVLVMAFKVFGVDAISGWSAEGIDIWMPVRI
jgi:hypothetical protein